MDGPQFRYLLDRYKSLVQCRYLSDTCTLFVSATWTSLVSLALVHCERERDASRLLLVNVVVWSLFCTLRYTHVRSPTLLRHVPQRAAQRPPCVPSALAGYGCELRSCTSTARRPYGIPTRTVWYCIGQWSQVRREESERGPACGAAHRRTPIEGSRHMRVRRPAPRDRGPRALATRRACSS